MGQRGGKRPGAGRKSKAESVDLDSLMARCWPVADREKVIRSLNAKALQGNMNAVSLLMAYTFGKPKERIEQKVTLSPQIESATMALMSILRQEGKDLDLEVARSLVIESYEKAGYTQELNTTA